jgi:hypothetical protein
MRLDAAQRLGSTTAFSVTNAKRGAMRAALERVRS